MSDTLTVKHARELVAARLGLRYEVQSPTDRTDRRWAIVRRDSITCFDHSYHDIHTHIELHYLMLLCFPDLVEYKSHEHDRWQPRNWRKGKYVGPGD